MQIKKYITRFAGQTIPTFVILSFLTDLQIVKASQPRSLLSINFGAEILTLCTFNSMTTRGEVYRLPELIVVFV